LTTLGDDVTRSTWIGFYLSAQTMDVDAEGIFEDLLQGPQAAQEKVESDSPVGIAHKYV